MRVARRLSLGRLLAPRLHLQLLTVKLRGFRIVLSNDFVLACQLILVHKVVEQSIAAKLRDRELVRVPNFCDWLAKALGAVEMVEVLSCAVFTRESAICDVEVRGAGFAAVYAPSVVVVLVNQGVDEKLLRGWLRNSRQRDLREQVLQLFHISS